MQRYFFHVHNDAVTLDEEGIELTGPAAAKETAIIEARQLACEEVRKGRLHLKHRIEVTDETGTKVATVTFADAIEIDS